MSGFGFGGFGQNNQNTSSGFGGFGSNNNNNTSGGFGTTNTNTGGFGNSGSLFGNASNTNTGTGFGGFGASGNAFGQNKTGFGTTATTSGGGLFGGGTATSGSGFGGFGGTTNTSGGFGNSTPSGGLFGQQNKPSGFGTSTTTGGLFGGSGTSGGFGAGAASSTGNAGFSGFGTSASAQNNGTGTTPFSETTEKDANATGNQINKFQSITTMDAYKNFSFEELRVVDYSQNRKQGSANGQAGGFGAGTAFGGFGGGSGTTAASGFGANNTSGGLFGQQNNTASTGFGNSNTSGGLFGAKPATGGLFGSTTTSAPSGGGLFGTSGGTGFGGSGFGNNTTSSTTTGGLFGTAQTQNKPAFGGFGNTATTGFGAPAAGGFGTAAQPSTAGGGLFGSSNPTTTGFGNTQQPASTGFSFGQNNQNNQQPAQTGGLFGGGFGQNNQPKPGGLFGSSTTTNTGGGLFGNTNNQPQQSGGLFGNTANQTQQTGGLFGSKPATGGLFGNTNTTNTGGLFGNNNQQQAGTGGLFGQSNNQQTGGLFGNKPPATGGLGSSLFGNTSQNTQPAAGGSLFGNPQQNVQQAGGSLFGNSLVPQQQPQQPGTLTASLLQNPYGNDALFANIGTPAQSAGPLATPLASSQKNKKQALIPAYKLSPAASSRLTTPQKRPAGYGFSYSTYGTPGSALPGSPFGFSTMLSPPYGRSLNKSMSTSNLRNSFSAEDSILNPAAFSSTVRGGTGRLKKLNVDRSLNSSRKPLFGTATPEPRKSVSFDTPTGPKETNGTSDLGPSNGALIRTESPSSEPELESNGVSRKNGASSRGKELAVVPEDHSPEAAPAVKPAIQVPRSHADQAPGGYWMKPTIDEIKALPRNEQANYKNFKVGCKNLGEITFSKVDLTSIPLEKILGDIVTFETRKVSVYGDATTLPKPPVGQGLNVPSTIKLANSWPRSNAGATEVLEKKGSRFEKHLNRLKRIPNTEFVDYNSSTGEWTFKVEHYTTYGLPDEEEEDESMLEPSILQDGMGTPTPLKVSKLRGQLSSPNLNSDASLPSPPDSSPDDTFDFKKGKRKHLPGQFDEEGMDDMEMYDEEEEVTGSMQSFLGQRSVGSSVADAEDASELGLAEDQEMAGSFPLPTRTTEPSTALAPIEPKSILKNSTAHGTPFKTGSVLFGDDWTEQLQRTVSPKKQDRAALRANQSITYKAPENEPTPKATDRTQPFATSMDIMNSLFNQSTRNASHAKFGATTLGSEYPYKRVKIRDATETEELDDAFHISTKPQWGPDGTLVYIAGPMAAGLGRNGVVEKFAASIVGEHNDVRFAKLSGSAQTIPPPTLLEQQNCTDISYEKGNVPRAATNDDFEFIQFAEVVSLDTLAGRMEQRAWELAHILFDETRDVPGSLSGSEKDMYLLRLRKDRVSEFWKKVVRNDVQLHVARAESLEEKAFAYLTGGLVEEACNALIEGKNFHLATLVAQIGCDKKFREAMSTQLESWRALNNLAEFEDSIRAIYELLAGNTCICRGHAAAGTENMTATFRLATRFNLDWRRSFGLRLWYGIDPEQDVTEAVLKYLEDLKDGSEEVKPVPWFTEQKFSTGWTDQAANAREDLLWSLLQLYGGDSFDLAAAFAPESVSGNPMDARLSFQLITLFQAQKVGVAADLGPETIDSLASTYAADLAATIESRPNALVSATWVLLHLSDVNSRQSAIRALLDQHAALIDPPDGKIFTSLRDLRVPDKWMYLSKALYARAVLQDPVAEAQNLLEAGEWTQAHEVVCHTVGPLAVIENDSDQLRELLGSLHDPVRKGNSYSDVWDKGAGIYYDFVEMRDLETQKGQRWKELVAKLARALERVNAEGGVDGKELRERAALQIMGNVVASYAAEGQVVGRNEGIKVPLTEDKYLSHSRALGLEYFKALMAAS